MALSLPSQHFTETYNQLGQVYIGNFLHLGDKGPYRRSSVCACACACVRVCVRACVLARVLVGCQKNGLCAGQDIRYVYAHMHSVHMSAHVICTVENTFPCTCFPGCCSHRISSSKVAQIKGEHLPAFAACCLTTRRPRPVWPQGRNNWIPADTHFSSLSLSRPRSPSLWLCLSSLWLQSLSSALSFSSLPSHLLGRSPDVAFQLTVLYCSLEF